MLVKRPSFLLTALLIAGLLAACGKPSAPADPTAAGAAPSAAEETSAAGSFDLADLTVGLAGLPAYQSHLRVSFTGVQAGQPAEWTQEYTLTVDRSRQARALQAAEAGLNDAEPFYPALVAGIEDLLYTRLAESEPCSVAFMEPGSPNESQFEPAAELPPVRKLGLAGPAEDVNGLSAVPRPIDPAGMAAEGVETASGQIWLAQPGGQVLRYRLELTAGSPVFGPDSEGTMTWEYDLTPGAPPTLLPADCPAALPELAVIEGAAEVVRLPNLLQLQAPGTAQSVLDYYTGQFSANGWQPAGDPEGAGAVLSQRYQLGDQWASLRVEGGSPARLSIETSANPSPAEALPAEASSPEAPQPTAPASAPGQAAVDQSQRIAGALNVLLGDDRTPSAFPSYHIEVTQRAPVWAGSAAGIQNSALVADVQGSAVHFTSTVDGAATEVYYIDDVEYVVENGAVREGLGLNALTWVMWPLDPVMILGMGAIDAQSAGLETVAGRPAEVYALSGSTASEAGALLAGFGLPVQSVQGTAWVDQETGALLRLQAQYTVTLRDSSGAEHGVGDGEIAIEVSQVGAVSVSLPQ